MKILHILKSEPDETTRVLMAGMSEGEEATIILLYEGVADYGEFIDRVFEHDRVVSWW
jgi:hypothetical protein